MDTLKRVLPVLLCWLLLSPSSSASTIGQIKATAQSGTQATVTGAVTYLEPAECYIESTDRSAGIRVLADTTAIAIGSLVTATGTYSFVSNEPSLSDATMQPLSGTSIITAFGMSNVALGGKQSDLPILDHKLNKIPGDGCEWQWTAASGPANTGLLVKTWGEVNAVYYSPVSGAKWFYIDDKSGATGDLADQGILVYSDADVKSKQYVSVTGISSVEPAFDDQTKLIRVLRTRDSSDVQIIRSPQEPVYPFSDEFDSVVLDKRWTVIPSDGAYSLTSQPGWLGLSAGLGRYYSTVPSITGGTVVSEPVQRNCDIEVKVHIDLDLVPYGEIRYIYLHDYAGKIDLQNYLAIFMVDGTVSPAVVTVILAKNAGRFTVSGDTCYFRIRVRDSLAYCSYSMDGTVFSSEYSIARRGPYISIGAIHLVKPDGQQPQPFAGYIDYIRFSNVGN